MQTQLNAASNQGLRQWLNETVLDTRSGPFSQPTLKDDRPTSAVSVLIVASIQFDWDTEVNQLLIHNAPLTCMLSKSKTRYSTEYNIIELYICWNTYIYRRCTLFRHWCRYSKRLPLQHFIKGYGIYIDNFTFKVGGCIGSAKRNLLHSRDSVTNIWYSTKKWLS